MAGMVGSAFLNPLCQRLINALIDTALDAYASVRGLKEEIEKLGKTVELIEAVLQDAQNRQETERPVRIWHGTLKQILYDAEDVLDEVATNAALQARDSTEAVRPASVRRMRAKVRNIICCFGTIIGNISADYKTAKQIKTIRERLDEKSRERDTLGLQRLGGSSMPTRPKRPETSSFLLDDASHVIGRGDEKKMLMELLLGCGAEIRGTGTSDSRKNVRFITIVGMAGVGKTTLARVAYNEPTVEKHFELRAWVCISNDFDVARITKEIIGAEVLNLQGAQTMLKTKLYGKRFLLVLDDMWEDDPSAWERLSPPFIYGAEGSRIVVTTRKMNISNIIKGTPIELKILPSEDLWSVFERYAFDGCDPNKRRQLEPIGREIVEKLQGSPLAAKTVGRLLNANQDVMHWESVRDSKICVRSQKSPDDILPILKLSYDYLPGYLKQCFAYCSLFPEDYLFRKDELVELWMSQNFIQVPRGVHVGEVLSDHFDSLLHASLFEQYEHYSTLEMHDSIHELAEYIYEDEYFRYDNKDGKSNKMDEKKRHLSIIATSKLDPNVLKRLCDHGNLRSLLFLRGYKFNLTSHLDDRLFMKLKRLRVLVLKFCNIQRLPESIGNLKHLRYVDISFTKIRQLPESICNLHNLQVLDRSSIFELSWPSNMCALVNLRLLIGPDVFKINGLGKLTALEAVQITGEVVRELADMRMLQCLAIKSLEGVKSKEDAIQAKLGSKKHLRELRLEWRDVPVENQGMEEEVLECLQPAKCIRELEIYNNRGAEPPSWLRDGSSWLSSSSLESVELTDCNNWQVLPALGQLPCLKSLTIRAMKSLKDMGGGQFQHSHFPSLEKLSLFDLPELVKWEVPWPPHEQNDDGDHDDRQAQHQLSLLPRLRELKIKNCLLLRQLPPLPPPLQKLEIERVGLTSLSASGWFPSSSSPALGSLQNLVKMEIKNCQDLSLSEAEFGHLASLTTLKVTGCPKLSWLTLASNQESATSPLSTATLWWWLMRFFGRIIARLGRRGGGGSL